MVPHLARNRGRLQEGIGGTTAAGKHSPQGDSPCGVADMAGNVLEWTSTLSKDYPYNPDDGREDPEGEGFRVSSGGSFNYTPRGVRCALRTSSPVLLPYQETGFRVVVSPGSPD